MRNLLIAVACILLTPQLHVAQIALSDSLEYNVRLINHLLSYMATDYPGAIKEGQVIDKLEFIEMQEFAAQADSLFVKIEAKFDEGTQHRIKDHLRQIALLVDQKGDVNVIREHIKEAKKKLIESSGVSQSPTSIPDFARAARIYQANCARCHGENGRGNGIAAAALDPKPSNFHDRQRMRGIAPVQAFNTIKLGVKGTSMVSYAHLSEEEIWDLAFYVSSLRYETPAVPPDSIAFATVELASTSDEELIAEYRQKGFGEKSIESAIAYYRTKLFDEQRGDWYASSLQALNKMEQAYANADYALARTHALSAYLDGFEIAEAQIAMKDESLMKSIEKNMMALRAHVGDRISNEELINESAIIKAQLLTAKNIIGKGKTSQTVIFTLSSGILLREGLEAFFIIITILSVLDAAGAHRAKRWVHGGTITAILLGFVAWFASGWVMQISGQNRELLEGFFALLAVAILLWVGFWMHRHGNMSHWKKFIEENVSKRVNSENLFGIALISFVAVFREAFESVIFLRAVTVENGNSASIPLFLAFVVSGLGLILIGVLIMKTTKRLPLHLLFRYGSFALLAFAIIMTGHGINAIQEAGWMHATSLPELLSAEFMGIYATTQTWIAQIMLLLFILAIQFRDTQKMKANSQPA